MSPIRLIAVAIAAAVGGMVNSIAGGGTLLTFPALIALGVPPLVANATSTVALWPGALSSMYGYRAHLRGFLRWSMIFAIPSLLGGGTGAWLLLHTSESRFEAIVPWLVLGATFLFGIQGPLMKRLRPQRELRRDDGSFAPRHGATALMWQFLVGVYGGYFGAGIGILMLAV
ncbi:MAG: sulfite exporter TauE/SafE family protein, partial [Acidobacteriota bacterium]